MSTQRHLFAPPPATGALTDRQQAALDHLTENPAGVRSTDLGAHLHQAMKNRCGCSDTVRCKWAMSEGERVGKQLRAREIAVKRKSGLWQLMRPPVSGYDPKTSDWPEGF